MLAQTEHLDVPNNDHLLVIFRKDGVVDHIHQTFFVAFRHPHESFGIAFRCPPQTFTVRIFTDALQYCPDCGRKDGEVLGFLFRSRMQPFLGIFRYILFSACILRKDVEGESPAHPKPSSSAIPPCIDKPSVPL